MTKLKKELARIGLREIIMYLLAAGCMVAAIVAVFLGMYIPPAGEVHSSILTYFGISSAFCGSLLGISAHYTGELARFKNDVMATLGETGKNTSCDTSFE